MARVPGNFGEGVARSAVLPDRTSQIIALGERKRASKAAKDAKDDEEWRKYLHDVNVKGVHRLDQESANENAAKTIHQMAILRQSYPHTWQNMVPEVMTQFQSKQNEFLSRKKYLDQLDSDYDKANQLGLSTPSQQKAVEAMRTGTWGDLSRVPSDDIGSFKFNPANNGVSMNFVPNFNKANYDKQILQDDYQTDLSMSTENIPGAPGGAKAVVERFNTPEEKMADFNMRALLGEPGYAKRAEAEFMAAKRLPPGYSNMPQMDEQNPTNPNTKFGVLYAENLKDIQRNAGTKTNVSIQKPPRPRADKSVPDEGLDAMLPRLTKDEPILASQVGSAGKKSTFTANAKYSLPVGTSAYTIVTADKETFNLADGKYFDEQAQFNFKPGSIKVVRLGKKGHEGYQAVVYGQAIDSKIPLDENGNPQISISGSTLGQTLPEKPAYKDVFVPLSKVKNLMTTKYKTPTKWAFEAVDKLNKELEDQNSRKLQDKNAEKKPNAEELRKKYAY